MSVSTSDFRIALRIDNADAARKLQETKNEIAKLKNVNAIAGTGGTASGCYGTSFILAIENRIVSLFILQLTAWFDGIAPLNGDTTLWFRRSTVLF